MDSGSFPGPCDCMNGEALLVPLIVNPDVARCYVSSRVEGMMYFTKINAPLCRIVNKFYSGPSSANMDYVLQKKRCFLKLNKVNKPQRKKPHVRLIIALDGFWNQPTVEKKVLFSVVLQKHNYVQHLARLRFMAPVHWFLLFTNWQFNKSHMKEKL